MFSYDYCRADINADRIAELRHRGDLGNFHTMFTAKLINRSDDSFFCVQRNKDLCGCAVPNRFFRLLYTDHLVRRVKF